MKHRVFTCDAEDPVERMRVMDYLELDGWTAVGMSTMRERGDEGGVTMYILATKVIPATKGK